MMLPVTVALATSFVPKAVVEIVMPPSVIPKVSLAETALATLVTVLLVICTPSSKPTKTPARPSGWKPPRLPLITVPRFLAAL